MNMTLRFHEDDITEMVRHGFEKALKEDGLKFSVNLVRQDEDEAIFELTGKEVTKQDRYSLLRLFNNQDKTLYVFFEHGSYTYGVDVQLDSFIGEGRVVLTWKADTLEVSV